MKKSKQVPASLVVALAASLAANGCSSGGYDECRDASGRILPSSACGPGMGYGGAHWVHTGGFGGSGGGSGGSFGG